MARLTSQAAEAIATRLQNIQPGSERHEVLQRAQRFFSSWVEMGELLTRVCDKKSYQQWGYASFETYCWQELHIRRDTAQKLTRSFSYVHKNAPDALNKQGMRQSLPPLDVVDLLSRASEHTQVSEEALAEIGQATLAGEGPLNRRALLKRLRDDDPEAFRREQAMVSTVSDPSREDMDPIELRKALMLAERLHSVLHAQAAHLAPDLTAASSELAQALRALYGASRQDTTPGVPRTSSSADLSSVSAIH